MDNRQGSIVDSNSSESYHTAPTSPISPGSVLSPAQSPAPARPSGDRRWTFGREPNAESDRRSKRDSVIRESVVYPSESEFEATIEKGTAQTGQRSPTKPRLVNLSHIRRKVRSLRRPSIATETTASTSSPPSPSALREAIELSRLEQETIKSKTDHQDTDDVFEAPGGIMLRRITESPASRDTPRPSRDKARRPLQRPEDPVSSSSTLTPNRAPRRSKFRRLCSSCCIGF
ncbi:hypothetical protein M426DRAFT_15155 [Hypoxylon sp. CI-4A]|nr:hypothetical protein M426DRAFT_15155 [Hypoxylon sp. CI-4A]